jgi:uroporphyrinogen decarboxylase
MPETSQERFLAACCHRVADRAPVDYLAHPSVDAMLRRHLRVDTEKDLLDRLGADFYYLPGRDISQNEGFAPFYVGTPLTQTETERICPLGIRFRRGAGQSKFAVDEAIAGPFVRGATPRDILDHPWPRPADFDFSPLQECCNANRERVLVGGLWSGILGDSYRMYGFDRFLLDMAAEPQTIHTLVDRMTEMYLQLNDAIFSLLRGKLDVWFFGNDFGHQQGLLFSANMWADFFAKNIKQMCDLAHSYGLRVMMHTCGSVAKLIPLLIEAGVDILDPVQVSAVGMNPAELKAAFGQQLVFHGGIDTQHVLPKASTEEAFQHARRTLKILGANGGYIFSPSQIFQADIPVENIAAVYRAAQVAEDAS